MIVGSVSRSTSAWTRACLLGQLGRERVLVRRWSRHVDPVGDQLIAASFQPVSELEVRDHVVAVVALDPLEDVGLRSLALAELQPRLEGDDAGAGIAQVDLPLEAVERLHPLDRVALDGRAERLADGAQEVDHHALAQQSVDFGLACPVTTHQALEGGRFVGRVVVDVHLRVGGEPRHQEIDQALEGRAFAVERELVRRIARPEDVERVVGLEHPEEVIQAVLERVRIALDIEEEVASRWRRERGKSPFRLIRLRRARVGAART